MYDPVFFVEERHDACDVGEDGGSRESAVSRWRMKAFSRSDHPGCPALTPRTGPDEDHVRGAHHVPQHRG